MATAVQAIFVLTALPLVLLFIIFLFFSFLVMPRPDPIGVPVLLSVIEAVLLVPTLGAFAAAASRIYQVRANLMTRSGD